jgi:hypothetical protein
MFIAIAVITALVGGGIAAICRDLKRNPGRDWHAEDGAL